MASSIRFGRASVLVAALRTCTNRWVSAPVRLLRGFPTKPHALASLTFIQPRRSLAGDSHSVSFQEVENRIHEVLKKFDKVDPSKVTVEAHFINDLGLDSLDVVEVVMAFEDEFGVEINDADAEKVLTIPDAVKLVARLMGVPEAAH